MVTAPAPIRQARFFPGRVECRPPRRHSRAPGYFAVAREKGPREPDFFSVSGCAVAAGQPPMPHPSSQAGPVPAPPAVPGPAGAGAPQPGTAPGGPGIGVPVTIWPHPPVPGSRPGSGPACAPCASCAGSVSGPGAGQIITAFSRPGELVVIPAARTGVLLAAAAAAPACPGPHPRPAVLPAGDDVPARPGPGAAPARRGPARRPGPAPAGRQPRGRAGRPGRHRVRPGRTARSLPRRNGRRR